MPDRLKWDSQGTSRDGAFRGTLSQAFCLKSFNVFGAVQHTTLQLQKNRPDTLGTPAFKGCLTEAPAFSQLALIQMFDTHDALLLVVANS